MCLVVDGITVIDENAVLLSRLKYHFMLQSELILVVLSFKYFFRHVKASLWTFDTIKRTTTSYICNMLEKHSHHRAYLDFSVAAFKYLKKF